MCGKKKALQGLGLFVACLAAAFLNQAAPVQAATGINQQLSFQGKVVNSNGTNIPDGTYDMEFKVYQDGNSSGTGSTLMWTEDYLVSGSTGMPSTGGVTVTSGTFQVNLGSICALSGGTCGAKTNTGVDFNQDTLWLSFEVGNTSSCTVTSSTSSFHTGCAGDGAMTPFIRLTAVPQAMNSNRVGGLTASQLVQLSPSGQQTGSINVSGGITTASTLTVQGPSTSNFSGNLAVTKAQNGITQVLVTNTNTGAAAAADFEVDNANGFGAFGAASSAYAAFPLLQNRTFLFSSNGLSGITLLNQGAQPIIFGISNAEVARFDTTGNFGIGINSPGGKLHVAGTSDQIQAIVQGNATQTSNILEIQNSAGTPLVSFNNNGYITASGRVGTSDAFTISGSQVLSRSGTTLIVGAHSFWQSLNLDTNGTTQLSIDSGGNINLGTVDTTGQLLTLDTKTSAGDPTGQNGGMYYNSNTGKFRCYQGGTWTDCVGAGGGVSLAAVDSAGSANANGATLTGSVLNLNSADVTHAGVINTTTQSFGGDKTFNGNLTISGSYKQGANTGSTLSCSSTQSVQNTTVSGGIITGGSCAAITLQNAYDNSSSPATITTSSSSKGVLIKAGASNDSTSLFQVQSAGSLAILSVDSSNLKLQIGSSTSDSNAVLLVLDSYNNATDPTGTNGAMYYNSSIDKFRCYQNSVWSDCLGSRTVNKASDQTANRSSTVLQNDNDLFFPMLANADYAYTLMIPVDDSNTSADLRYSISLPAGAAITAFSQSYSTATAAIFCNIIAGGQVCSTTVNNANNMIVMQGVVRNGGTAGNWQFQFAQNTSTNADFPVIKAGGTLSYYRQ